MDAWIFLAAYSGFVAVAYAVLFALEKFSEV